MRTISTLLVSATLVTLFAPAVAAGPNCLMVYPWSELCQGDVDGFVDAVNPCDDLECIATTDGGPAVAEPQCLQVYPWSELCQGDVGGFSEGMIGCDVTEDCVTLTTGNPLPRPPTMDCIQVIPWSYLCSGNVQAFVEYYTGDVGEILA